VGREIVDDNDAARPHFGDQTLPMRLVEDGAGLIDKCQRGEIEISLRRAPKFAGKGDIGPIRLVNDLPIQRTPITAFILEWRQQAGFVLVLQFCK